MADTETPVWFQLLREDIASFRTETNQRLDKLVTQDAFDAERKRTEERFADQGRDIVANHATALQKVKDAADGWKAELDEVQARTRAIWGGIRWAIGTLIAVAGLVLTIVTMGGQ